MVKLWRATVLVGFLVVLPVWASAQMGVTYFSRDTILNTVLSDSLFVAEGRIGDLGGTTTFELDLGQSTAVPAATADFAWGNGTAYPFTVTYDAATRLVTYTLGGHTLSFVSNFGYFDTVFIRAWAANAGSFVGVYNLYLNGASVPGALYLYGANGLNILQVFGVPLQNGFTLTGLAKLRWDGVQPSDGALSFQIRVANMLVVPTQDRSWGQVKSLFR